MLPYLNIYLGQVLHIQLHKFAQRKNTIDLAIFNSFIHHKHTLEGTV